MVREYMLKDSIKNALRKAEPCDEVEAMTIIHEEMLRYIRELGKSRGIGGTDRARLRKELLGWYEEGMPDV